ncbi:MAG: Asp23/Gls24 family envelope stress response protein [Chloroflexota bacterium]
MTEGTSSRAVPQQGTGGAIIETSGEGKTHISDIVVAKIAAAACREVGGIHDMGRTGVGGAVSGAIGAVTGGSDQQSTKGVSVQVGEQETIVNVDIIVDYGTRIPQIADALRTTISERLNTLTGLTVRAVNIEVSDVYFPQQQRQQPELA